MRRVTNTPQPLGFQLPKGDPEARRPASWGCTNGHHQGRESVTVATQDALRNLKQNHCSPIPFRGCSPTGKLNRKSSGDHTAGHRTGNGGNLMKFYKPLLLKTSPCCLAIYSQRGKAWRGGEPVFTSSKRTVPYVRQRLFIWKIQKYPKNDL